MKRDVMLSLEFKRGEEGRILGLMLRLCDFLDFQKQTGDIEDYGLALVVPQVDIVSLPTHVIHVDKDPEIPPVRKDRVTEATGKRMDQR